MLTVVLVDLQKSLMGGLKADIRSKIIERIKSEFSRLIPAEVNVIICEFFVKENGETFDGIKNIVKDFKPYVFEHAGIGAGSEVLAICRQQGFCIKNFCVIGVDNDATKTTIKEISHNTNYQFEMRSVLLP